jgi:hypothetical protein
MSLNKLLIAVAVLAVIVGFVVWDQKHPQDKTAATPAAPKLLSVPDTQVVSVDLQKKGSPPVTLSKDKTKWAITAPQPYAADQDSSTSLVSALSGVNADSSIEDAPTDLAKYGLTDPSLTVTVHEKSGKTDKLLFGDDVPTGSSVYAQVAGDKKVYLVSSSLKSSFNKELNDLRDKRLLTFDSTQVSRVELVSPKSDIEFGKVNQTDWQIVKPAPYRADSFQVEDILRKLSDAKMDLSAKPDDAPFNTGKPVAKASVTDASGVQSLDVRQNKDDYYARSSQVPGTFKITADLGKLLGKPLDDFRNKKLFDFGFSDLSKLEISGKTYTRSGTDWKSGATNMDPGSVQNVIDKLRDLAATDFVTTGFNAPDVAITAVSNDGKRTEKVELSKSGDGYVARREGQPALYKLDAKSVNDILEAAAAIKPSPAAPKK